MKSDRTGSGVPRQLRIDFAAKADALMCLNEFPNENSIHGAQREFMAKPIHDNVVVDSLSYLKREIFK